MRKTTVLIILIFLAIPIYSAGYFYFRSVTWGMSHEQVEKKIARDYRVAPQRIKGGLELADKVCSRAAKLYFKFHDEKLYSIVMTFEPVAGEEKILRECVLKGIENKYGHDYYSVTANYYRWEREAVKITADFGNTNKFIVTYTDQDISEEILKEKERLLKEKMGG